MAVSQRGAVVVCQPDEGESPLEMLWVLMPGGLEDFFQAIGRPRTPGEAAPEPFPRPENVEQVERDTVFASLDGTPSKDGR